MKETCFAEHNAENQKCLLCEHALKCWKAKVALWKPFGYRACECCGMLFERRQRNHYSCETCRTASNLRGELSRFGPLSFMRKRESCNDPRDEIDDTEYSVCMPGVAL